MNDTHRIELVSVHGGHSAQFCNHAHNSLEEIIQAYVQNGFTWVGITEHAPPLNNRFLYPDEKKANLDARLLKNRFGQYMATGRDLQKSYRSQIDIFIGFETETYSGAIEYMDVLRRKYAPDYIVGSVHHVDDICFDFSSDLYRQAVETAGGLDGLYERYFDLQYRMITRLEPDVVGHFDLVRIYDDSYTERVKKPHISERIRRNLNLIADLDLILDLNVRSYAKGAVEPYPARWLVEQALELGITIVPGDDSHGVDTVGLNLAKGMAWLKKLGGSMHWRRPGCQTDKKLS